MAPLIEPNTATGPLLFSLLLQRGRIDWQEIARIGYTAETLAGALRSIAGEGQSVVVSAGGIRLFAE